MRASYLIAGAAGLTAMVTGCSSVQHLSGDAVPAGSPALVSAAAASHATTSRSGAPTPPSSTITAPAPAPAGSTGVDAPGPRATGSAPSAPSAPSGEFVGRFTQVDTATAVGLFTVRCPVADRGKDFTVNLRGGTFEDTSNRADPAAGHAVELTFAQWAGRQSGSEWDIRITAPASPVQVLSTSLPSDHTVC